VHTALAEVPASDATVVFRLGLMSPGLTLLQWAAQHNLVSLVQVLLDAGADPATVANVDGVGPAVRDCCYGLIQLATRRTD